MLIYTIVSCRAIGWIKISLCAYFSFNYITEVYLFSYWLFCVDVFSVTVQCGFALKKSKTVSFSFVSVIFSWILVGAYRTQRNRRYLCLFLLFFSLILLLWKTHSWRLQMCIGCHELLHALGSDHEQDRSDRDQYVIINAAYIMKGALGNFQKRDPDENINYAPYDFGSVLHYGACTL